MIIVILSGIVGYVWGSWSMKRSIEIYRRELGINDGLFDKSLTPPATNERKK